MPTLPPPRQRPTPRAFAVAVIAVTVVALVASVAAGFVAPISVAAQDAKRAAATVATASAAPKEILSVAGARKRPAGEVVTVEGFVTVPSGLFKSGTSDEGFALQDASGGIYVRTAANLRLRLGRQVRVTGQLTDSNGQLILLTADARGVSARGRGAHTRAESVATARVNEATEGRLVRVTGTITKPVGNDLPYGYRLFINDGSGEVQAFVYVSTGVNVSGFQPGQRVGVTGFSGQYNDHYEVIPRFRTDIQRIR
ncbi:MAG: hypothetical protein QOD32_3366 [Pyrinomonadaceae bacterium]|jgi:uncharacterized protein YdeI (BOF family)|nr:hypothetical protein [Pyrinomonadaceae bacterium]